MPRRVTIESLPQVIKEMRDQGYDWGEDYRCAGGDALADILEVMSRFTPGIFGPGTMPWIRKAPRNRPTPTSSARKERRVGSAIM